MRHHEFVIVMIVRPSNRSTFDSSAVLVVPTWPGAEGTGPHNGRDVSPDELSEVFKGRLQSEMSSCAVRERSRSRSAEDLWYCADISAFVDECGQKPKHVDDRGRRRFLIEIVKRPG